MDGYITLALDQQRYLNIAVNLARSVKFFDKERPICLLYNNRVEITSAASEAFDSLIEIPDRPGYIGCANKIRIFDYTPFDRTMYIDADCLMVMPDIDRHWNNCTGHFSITGAKRTSGKWNDLDLAEVCAKMEVPYVVQMNSGVFAFDKSAEAARFFEFVNYLFAEHRQFLSYIHGRRSGQYADEPLLGTAMGHFRLEPVNTAPGQGSWMVSTWQAKNCRFDPAAGISRIDKPKGFYWNIPLVAKGWVRHAPTIAHFIALAPRRAYADLARFFEDQFANAA